MPVVINISVVDVALHWSLPRDVSFPSMMARNSNLK
jgi:hypothetical protein